MPLGSIPWFMVAEMFLQDARPAAVTMAVIVNWTTNFAVGLSFPLILVTMATYGNALCHCYHPIQDALYPYALLVFAGLCGFFWLFTYVFVPETKGKTVEEIVSKFKHTYTR